MITPATFSPFVHALYRFVVKSHPQLHLWEIRKAVATSLDLPKKDQLLERQLERCPIPFDSAICQRIAAHFESLGIRLPRQAWEWPLPARFPLIATERLGIWQEIIQPALQRPSRTNVWLSSYASVEPYIVPDGSGRWLVCNRSPVPFEVCSAAFGATLVIDRRHDNSIADGVPARHAADLVFEKALAANWRKDDPTAFALFNEAANAGHADAALHVAWMLEAGQGVERDDREAVRYFQIAAKRDVAKAHHELGGIFLHGNTVLPSDIKQAIAHFETSANGGVAASFGCLASIYFHGNGVPADRNKAEELLMKGVAGGDDHSLNVLATIMDKENGGVSTAQTFQFYRRAARRARQWGHAMPFFNLGLCYQHGRGVTQNLCRARRLFLIAASMGDADAALNLGVLHLRGEGTPVDLEKALHWIEQAAAMDCPEAVNMLGSIHLTGKHIPPAYGKAVELFQRAQALGSVDAVVNLAQCAALGLGVKKNVRRAFMLLGQAESRGSVDAMTLRVQWHAAGLGGARQRPPSADRQR